MRMRSVENAERIRFMNKEKAGFCITYSKAYSERCGSVHRCLTQIEASFKVTRTCFASRLVYVWLNKHIEVLYTTCFLALVLISLLERKLDYLFPIGPILNSLKKYNACYSIRLMSLDLHFH